MNLLKELVPESNRVISGFSSAAKKYDTYAKHHKLIASTLLKQLNNLNLSPLNCLELGCGSGILSEGLVNLFPKSWKVFSDGSEEMLSLCKRKTGANELHKYQKINFNETLNNIASDLIVSSCSLQWLEYPEKFVRNLPEALSKNGFIAHAIPVKGMLYELHDSFQQTDSHWSSLSYKTGEEWSKLFEDNSFNVITSFTRSFTVSYKSSIDVLKAVRGIGASLSNQKEAITISTAQLRNTLNYYQENYSKQDTVPSTYNILFIIAQLKESD